MEQVLSQVLNLGWVLVPVLIVLVVVLKSLVSIGETEMGLVTKRFALKKLSGSNPIAFHGEAGYQKDVLRAGLRFVLWPLYSVKKFPLVQIPSGQIGLVFAQIGKPLPSGAKSGKDNAAFGNFENIEGFLANNGEQGLQQRVLPPGTVVAIHPVAFLVITKGAVFGEPIMDEHRKKGAKLSPSDFGIDAERMQVVRLQGQTDDHGQRVDYCGIVTVHDGPPVPAGDIASRIGGFTDIEAMEKDGKPVNEVIETLLGGKNKVHNNYQDFAAYLAQGGCIGLQHDTLLPGTFVLNPVLVGVESVPMLVVRQGQVAVIQSSTGLAPEDTSGAEFKHGTLVRPGHRGIWEEALRPGKYPLNPRLYRAEIVPTAILTLNWADQVSAAHQLDKNLSPIVAKSKEGFEFKIDLQVQIHIPDTKASRVISMVGTIQNLVNEVLEAAVGNYFRNTLQSMEATKFIEQRETIQQKATQAISTALEVYQIETKGVYIQDVVLPKELVKVLQDREIANQQQKTFEMERAAQQVRATMEEAKGTADKQAELAGSVVAINISENKAKARENEGRGEASFIQQTGEAEGKKRKAIGEGDAAGYKTQVDALGADLVAAITMVEKLAQSGQRLVPEVSASGASGSGSLIEALLGSALQKIRSGELPLPGAPVEEPKN